jgi:TRAP-type transport system small permease protein
MDSIFKSIASGIFKLLDFVMVSCLAIMLILVFTNVVLRLGFNTGIDLAEELPRFAFIWLAFVGGVVGLHRRSHLGVDMLVAALPVLGRKICWSLSQIIMGICSFYMLYGTWLQHDVIKENASTVMQVSMLWVYGISYLSGAGIMLICLSNLIRLALGRVTENELIDVQEEGMAEAEEAGNNTASTTVKAGEQA